LLGNPHKCHSVISLLSFWLSAITHFYILKCWSYLWWCRTY